MNSDQSPDFSAHQTKMAMAELMSLPLVSADFPGIGGEIKATPEHFKVEERLPYTACGEGEHVYITFRRSGWNTVDAAREMQKALKVSPSDVGWGGRKDKTAVVVQTFSFHLGVNAALEDVKISLSSLPFEILEVNRHLNKIKTGHVAANRFTIGVNHPVSDAFSRAQTIAEHLKRAGVPNFYGPQRFGYQFQNVARGFSLFRPNSKSRKDDFLVSVVQSAMFNIWLKNRMEDGNYHRLLEGDIARKTDTGGMFDVLDPIVEGERFERGEIVYTGPMYGFKMKTPKGAAGARETELLDRFGLAPEDFRKFRAPGSRREAMLSLSDLEIRPVEEGLEFSFTLPSGAYATTVLREFTHLG